MNKTSLDVAEDLLSKTIGRRNIQNWQVYSHDFAMPDKTIKEVKQIEFVNSQCDVFLLTILAFNDIEVSIWAPNHLKRTFTEIGSLLIFLREWT